MTAEGEEEGCRFGRIRYPCTVAEGEEEATTAEGEERKRGGDDGGEGEEEERGERTGQERGRGFDKVRT